MPDQHDDRRADAAAMCIGPVSWDEDGETRRGRSELRDRQLIENDCRTGKRGAHLTHQRAFFGAGEEDDPHAVVTFETFGQLDETFRRPAPAGMTRAGENPDERRLPTRFLLSQQSLDRSVIFRARRQARRTRRRMFDTSGDKMSR